MLKRKMRKFEDGGDVDAMEAANASAEAQALMDEAKGEEILKRMRDAEAAPKRAPRPTPKPMAKEMPESLKSTPKATTVEKTVVKTAPSRANENYSNEGRGRPTAKEMPSAIKKRSEYERPNIGGMIGRGISDFFGSIRERGRKSNPEAYAKGGSVGSASNRADGIAQRGKTKGKIC
jgi:hypothetical protein